MKAIVTGVAGFIGSQVAARLLAEGMEVVGLDAFTPYYDTAQKRANVAPIERHPSFRLLTEDLLTIDWQGLLADDDAVFHLAAQPGVRASWGQTFHDYVDANVLVTQRLLDACRSVDLCRFVYSSSSSVYGDAVEFPTGEDSVPRPFSPYGVTKLAGEHLCGVYAANYGIPTVSLRYFTVFGPRQRPDMAFHRLIDAALNGGTFTLNGTGQQTRDFTYVDDVVQANWLAATHGSVPPGVVLNIGGGASVSLQRVIDDIVTITGRNIDIVHGALPAGDPKATAANTYRANEVLGWKPAVHLFDGLREQVDWHRSRQ